jgi:2-iminoacetate synthase ThiH
MSLGAANYLTCIQKWEKDPDILNFKSVNYEELVSNPNEISEDIFNFCDIDGGYNLKDRGNFLARTASQNQIKQDIHQKSVNKQEFQSHKKEFDQSFEQQLDFWQKKGFYTKN